MSWFHLLLAAYLLSMLLSTIASADPSRSAVKLAGKLYLVMIAFVSFNIVVSIQQLRAVFYAWLAGAAIVLSLSLLGIAAFYLGLSDPAINPVVHPIYGSLPEGYYPRVEGLFEYPSMLSNFLGVTWMLAVACKLNGWLKEPYFWLFGALLFLVNVFTLTPGLGGIFLSTGILLWLTARPETIVLARAYLSGGVIIAILFFAAASITLFSYDPSGVRLPLAEGEVSASHRAKAWVTGLQTFRESLILGKGVGMPVSEAMYTDPNGNNQILTDAHNMYISVLAETGLFGFAAFYAMLLFVIWGLAKHRMDAYRWVRLCLLLALTDAVFYQGLTGAYEDARHLWVIFGIAASAGTRLLQSEEQPSGFSLNRPDRQAISS